MDFKNSALAIKDKLINYRRDFHSNPELSFCEKRTNNIIRNFLNENNIEIQEIDSGYSIVGIIRGSYPGKTIALRADMDALPINELNDVSYKSKIDNIMHACGHDGHTASLMGAAILLNNVKSELHGNVKLFFQAAEEKLPGGAIGMIKHGALENPYVDAVIGFHINNHTPVGKIAYGKEPGHAASDSYKFTIIGKGGHGAFPHTAIDPIIISAYFVTALQTIVSRNVEPTQGAVITIGSIHGGSKENIIADKVEMLATVRALDPNVRELLHKRIEEICKGTEQMYHCKVEYSVELGYPVLLNNAEFIDKYAIPSTEKIIGSENVIHSKKPNMGGEDFAYFLQERPGCFGSLGAGNKEKGFNASAHSANFDFDENCIPIAAATFAQIAWDFLNENN